MLNFSSQPAELPQGLVPQGAQTLLSSYNREGGWQGTSTLRPYEATLFLLPAAQA